MKPIRTNKTMKKQIHIKNLFGTVYTFEIVNAIPDGYSVWNISRQDFPHGYIPLAKSLPNDDDLCLVDTDTLKALKVESEELALYLARLAGRGDINSDNYVQCVSDFYRQQSK